MQEGTAKYTGPYRRQAESTVKYMGLALWQKGGNPRKTFGKARKARNGSGHKDHRRQAAQKANSWLGKKPSGSGSIFRE